MSGPRSRGDVDGLVDGNIDGYTRGFRDGWAACDAALAALHRQAASVTGAAIRLPVVTDMSGDDAALRARAAERERASIARFRADHARRRGEAS